MNRMSLKKLKNYFEAEKASFFDFNLKKKSKNVRGDINVSIF